MVKQNQHDFVRRCKVIKFDNQPVNLTLLPDQQFPGDLQGRAFQMDYI